MSLTSIGQTSSNGIGTTPSHQAIGKNGSFWLPQKMDQSFDSKVKNPTHGKESQRQGNQTKGDTPTTLRPGDKASIKASSDGGRGTLTSSNLYRGKSLNTQSFAPTKFGPMSAKAPSVKSLSSGSATPVRVLSADQAIHSQQAKSMRSLSRNQPNWEANQKGFVSPDQERNHNGGKHRGKRGAKNALIDSKMDIAHTQQDFKVMDGKSPTEPASTVPPKARSFLKLLTDSVAPRIAYLDKNTRKVVRFAVDLPNKGKLGVRLEESGNSVSLCFICSDPESLELLGFTREALSGVLSNQSGKNTEVNIFNNYKEMDEHFSRAA